MVDVSGVPVSNVSFSHLHSQALYERTISVLSRHRGCALANTKAVAGNIVGGGACGSGLSLALSSWKWVKAVSCHLPPRLPTTSVAAFLFSFFL